jgi:hypothetical protein
VGRVRRSIVVLAFPIVLCGWTLWPKVYSPPSHPGWTAYFLGLDLRNGPGILGRLYYLLTISGDPDLGDGEWRIRILCQDCADFKRFYPDRELLAEGKCRMELIGSPLFPCPRWDSVEWANCYKPDGTIGSQVRNGTGNMVSYALDGSKSEELELRDFQRVRFSSWYSNGQLRFQIFY